MAGLNVASANLLQKSVEDTVQQIQARKQMNLAAQEAMQRNANEIASKNIQEARYNAQQQHWATTESAQAEAEKLREQNIAKQMQKNEEATGLEDKYKSLGQAMTIVQQEGQKVLAGQADLADMVIKGETDAFSASQNLKKATDHLPAQARELFFAQHPEFETAMQGGTEDDNPQSTMTAWQQISKHGHEASEQMAQAASKGAGSHGGLFKSAQDEAIADQAKIDALTKQINDSGQPASPDQQAQLDQLAKTRDQSNAYAESLYHKYPTEFQNSTSTTTDQYGGVKTTVKGTTKGNSPPIAPSAPATAAPSTTLGPGAPGWAPGHAWPLNINKLPSAQPTAAPPATAPASPNPQVPMSQPSAAAAPGLATPAAMPPSPQGNGMVRIRHTSGATGQVPEASLSALPEGWSVAQ